MATIRPFRAIRPSTEKINPLAFLREVSENGWELDYVKLRLEPHKSGTGPSHNDCIEFLHSLLENGSYVQEKEPCLYVYECIIGGRAHSGVFSMTSLVDLEKGGIFTHEQTLDTLEEQISSYRKEVGLEGAAILLTHEPNAAIAELITRAKFSRQGFSYAYGKGYHKFWRVSPSEHIAEFQLAFSSLRQVYLADGHHRLGAAEKLHRYSQQWICSLYMSSDELEIEPFHRLITPNREFDLQKKMGQLEEYFFISPIPNNIPYRPAKKNRFGMWLVGQWFQLDLRPELKLENPVDAEFLQQKVLGGIFGIASPRTDQRLKCFSDGEWKLLLLEMTRETGSAVFTLYGLGMEEFMRLSLLGKILPPKSTSIGPKPPYGMLMHCEKLLAGKGEEK